MSWGTEENKEKNKEKNNKKTVKKDKEIKKNKGQKKTEKNVKKNKENKKEKQKYNFNNDKNIRKNYTWLLYGQSSSGKTYTSLTFPGNIVIIDTENRAEITKRECFPDKKIHVFKPKVLLEEADEHGKVIDYRASLENLNNFILQLVKDIQEGNVDVKTVVIDSMSDVWWWAINWAMLKLVDKVNKDGSKKVDIDMLHFKNQMNWFMPKNKHKDIFEILKVLTNHGVDIVFTARNKTIPEYVKDKSKNDLHTQGWEERVRCEKSLPYDCDIVIRQVLTQENKRKAIIEKYYNEKAKDKIFENLTYKKLKEVLK